MTDLPHEHHISSAVVSVMPQFSEAVAGWLETFPDTEIHHIVPGKIVIVMEGPSAGVIGERLTQIALGDHVLSANMVYEIIDTEAEDEEGEE
ncbi:MAG: chaperone NapD [Rhodospirillales bacterium]